MPSRARRTALAPVPPPMSRACKGRSVRREKVPQIGKGEVEAQLTFRRFEIGGVLRCAGPEPFGVVICGHFHSCAAQQEVLLQSQVVWQRVYRKDSKRQVSDRPAPIRRFARMSASPFELRRCNLESQHGLCHAILVLRCRELNLRFRLLQLRLAQLDNGTQSEFVARL